MNEAAAVFAGQVVENSGADHHVEVSEALPREITDVVGDEFGVRQAHRLRRPAGDSVVSLTSFDSQHFCAMNGALDCKEPLEAAKVKNTHILPRLTGQVCN